MTKSELEANIRLQLNTGQGRIHYGPYVFIFFGKLDPVTLQEMYDLTILNAAALDSDSIEDVVLNKIEDVSRETTISTIYKFVVRHQVGEILC